MATKRTAVSAVNWKKFADVVPPGEGAESISRYKARSMAYVNRISSNPADLPKLDFAAFKKRAPEQAAVFDALQKQYESIKIPYPTADELLKDIENATVKMNEHITKQRKTMTEEAETLSHIEKKYQSMPPIKHMNFEQEMHYFPELYWDTRKITGFKAPPGETNDPKDLQWMLDYKFAEFGNPDKEH